MFAVGCFWSAVLQGEPNWIVTDFRHTQPVLTVDLGVERMLGLLNRPSEQHPAYYWIGNTCRRSTGKMIDGPADAGFPDRALCVDCNRAAPVGRFPLRKIRAGRCPRCGRLIIFEQSALLADMEECSP